MRLHGVDLGHGLDDRPLHLGRDLVRLLQRQLARELEVQRDLRPRPDLQDGQVVDLAHPWHTLGRGERALGELRVPARRLDVNNDVAAWQRVVDGGLHSVGGRMALAHRGAR